MLNVEKLWESVWEKLWEGCEKVSGKSWWGEFYTYFGLVLEVFHRTVEKFCLRFTHGLTEENVMISTVSTYPITATTNLYREREL